MLLPQPIPVSLLAFPEADCEPFFARGCLPLGEVADGCDCEPLISNVCASAGMAINTTEQSMRSADFFFTGIDSRTKCAGTYLASCIPCAPMRIRSEWLFRSSRAGE